MLIEYPSYFVVLTCPLGACLDATDGVLHRRPDPTPVAAVAQAVLAAPRNKSLRLAVELFEIVWPFRLILVTISAPRPSRPPDGRLVALVLRRRDNSPRAPTAATPSARRPVALAQTDARTRLPTNALLA